MSQLVWVSFGNYGRQLAVVAKTKSIRIAYVGHKWRDASRRWTRRVGISHYAVIGPVDAEETGKGLVKRAMACLKEQTGLAEFG